MKNKLIKKASAIIPIAMSIIALAMVIFHTLKYGISHENDEGTAAHIFQLLMIIQLPIVIYFAIKWLPTFPRQSLLVISFQAIAALAAIIAVFFLTQ